jgi:hypothetical protein
VKHVLQYNTPDQSPSWRKIIVFNALVVLVALLVFAAIALLMLSYDFEPSP